MVVRNDSAAATGAWTRWLSVAGNGTWTLGVNNTISNWPPTFKSVSTSTNVVYAIGNTSFSIGCGRATCLHESGLLHVCERLLLLCSLLLCLRAAIS